MSDNLILASLDDPEALERLYRSDKEHFRLLLEKALDEHPNREVLKVWSARLHYRPIQKDHSTRPSIQFVLMLCVLAGGLAKLPAFLPIHGDWYYPRFIPFIIFGALIAYFFRRIDRKRIKIWLLLSMSGCLLILLFLPDNYHSASITMSLIHMPLVLVSLLAVGFTGAEWQSAQSRLSYIRYLGEILIYSSVILLGGIVLTLLTLGLFDLIGISIIDFYAQYIVVFGLMAAPIVATYLYDSVLDRASKVAPLLSNVFAPLFLITVVVYLLAVLYQGKTPYSDRDFLIIFNGLLVVVWAIAVFSIAGSQVSYVRTITNTINIALIATTLMINSIALSAIIFRLSEYGITPNRVTVVGANTLIFIHLILILKAYAGYMRKGKRNDQLVNVVTNYLPVYFIWALCVVIVLPLVFRFA